MARVCAVYYTSAGGRVGDLAGGRLEAKSEGLANSRGSYTYIQIARWLHSLMQYEALIW
jgi:hypothetical protein